MKGKSIELSVTGTDPDNKANSEDGRLGGIKEQSCEHTYASDQSGASKPPSKESFMSKGSKTSKRSRLSKDLRSNSMNDDT